MLVRRALLKRPGRALMTTTAVAVAVALLVALQSLAAGFLLAQTAEVRERTVDVLVQPLATRGDPQDSGPRAAGVEDAHAFATELAAIEGVASASPTLESFLVVNGSERVLQVIAQGVVPAEHLEGISQAQKEKFDGYFTSAAEDPQSGEVVINQALAQAAGISKGDELAFAPSPTETPRAFRVVGIFETPFTGTGILGGVNLALFHLGELQALTGLDERDAATRIAVRLDPEVREDPAATARIVAELRDARPGYQALTKADELEDASERAAIVSGFYTAVAYVSLIVSALFVASVMVMEVQERRRDLGVLRALGWSRRSVFLTVAAQAMVFVAMGTALGIVLGYFASEGLGDYFRRGYGIDVDFTSFTTGLVIASVVQALVVGLFAALVPAWRATRVDALEVIRRAI